VTTAVEFADARSAVLAYAARHPPDVLVLGARGVGALARATLGSTSLHCVRHHAGDVLVVKENVRESPRVLLACWDGSPAATKALHRAASLARAGGSDSVVMLTVFTPRVASLGERFRTACDPNLDDYISEYNEQDLAALQACAAGLLAASPALAGVELVVRQGSPAQVIAAEAAERHASIVFLGSHGAGLVERLLLGSVSEDVLLHVPADAIYIAKVPSSA
jgi:nucleotide-binding universal stress UspA family protein